MKDKDLAAIFYIIVHDFNTQIAREACAQLKHDNSSEYIKSVQNIRKWAQENHYHVIKDRAEQLLKKIDELTEVK